MRYVFYALAALVASLMWLNHSQDGRRLKHRLMAHPDQPAQLY